MIPMIDTVQFRYIAKGVMQCSLTLNNGYIVSVEKQIDTRIYDGTLRQVLFGLATEKLKIIQDYHSSIADTTNIVDIAKVAHEVNRAYCKAIGDHSQVDWNTSLDLQRSAIQGVQYRLANLDATPEDQHNAWMEAKLEDGWVYGEVKNTENKTHPCLVPYSELPKEQQIKDYLFAAVVEAMI